MSLRRRIGATYVSQLYVAVVGLAATPLYLRALGAEGYGLVGFFAMLLAWFQLLDLGLSPVAMREVARWRAGALDAAELRRTARAMVVLFALLAGAGALVILALAEPIAHRWLEGRALDTGALVVSVRLMALTAALRFLSILPRGLLTGLEQLGWLARFNAAIATARAFAVLPAMAVFGGTPEVFFTTQLVIGAVELALAGLRARRALPRADAGPARWSLAPLRRVWRFSAMVAFTGGLGVVLTQSDRLVLSGLLPLADYAHFSLAVLAASAVLLAGSPLGTALQPRMSALAAAGEAAELERLYRQGALVLGLLTLPAAATLALHPHAVLLAWTGDAAAAAAAAPVLALYAAGNAVLAQLTLPYAVQFAHGRLRLHLLGNAVMIGVLLPGQVLLTQRFGAVGAGAFWLAVNLAYALAWVPVALRPLAPGLVRPWFTSFARLAAPAVALAALATPAVAWAQRQGRLTSGLVLLLLTLALTALLVASHAQLRHHVADLWRARFGPRPQP